MTKLLVQSKKWLHLNLNLIAKVMFVANSCVPIHPREGGPASPWIQPLNLNKGNFVFDNNLLKSPLGVKTSQVLCLSFLVSLQVKLKFIVTYLSSIYLQWSGELYHKNVCLLYLTHILSLKAELSIPKKSRLGHSGHSKYL